MIASGMDRGQFPGYVRGDETKSGAVDFIKEPTLTHPIGAVEPLLLDLSGCGNLSTVSRQMLDILKGDLDGNGGPESGLCSFFEGNPAALAAARFHYVHHALRERLAMENVGGLGSLWYRIPADTRMPDHSIWHHCALVSALATCFHESPVKGASLVVFSLTPVQDFISRARKLRDFWVGSLILSWLAFEGICGIMYRFGSDHVLYPSLIGQPMVNRLLRDECGFAGISLPAGWDRARGIASFPNKFVFLAPTLREAEIAEYVKERIQAGLGRTGSGDPCPHRKGSG